MQLGEPKIASAIKKLNNRQYMQSRAKGGFVQNKRLEKAKEQVDANVVIDKQIAQFQKILDTGTYSMGGGFIFDEPVREYNIPEGVANTIRRINRGTERSATPGNYEPSIRRAIDVLERKKQKNLKQIEKIAGRVVKNYNLLRDYEVMTIVNQDEEGSQDLDYRLMRRGK